MADGKLTYDIDFNVYTESISRAVSKAVDAGFGFSSSGGAISYTGTDTYNASRAAAASYSVSTPPGITTFLYDQARAAANNSADPLGAAIAAQGLRANTVKLLPFVAERLGIGTPYFNNLGVTSVTEWAQAATQNPYGFTPGTAQTMIRAQVDAGLRRMDRKTDKEYVFEAEKYTNDVRAGQTFERKGLLAEELTRQGDASMAAAEAAGDLNVAIAHYQRAASRYSSVAARTLVESGAVTQEDANIATIKAVDARQRVAEIRASMKGEARKEAEIDAAWAAREKELAYNPSQKAREMDRGFRTLEAMSATEDMYNPAKDIYAQQQGVGNAIGAAADYIQKAGSYSMGSAERRAYLRMASSSLNGITPSFMSSIGMNSREIANNSIKIEKLTDQIDALRGDAPTGGDSAFWTRLFGPAAAAGAVMALLKGAGTVMEGRTQWLADPLTPYQTRRDVRQGFAQNFGKAAAGVGAGAGALVGAKVGAGLGTVFGPAGTVVGGAVGAGIGAVAGALPGAVSYLLGTHYKDEKKIGDNWQSEAIKMARYYNLYGSAVDYNFSGAVQNTGYMSRESVLQLNQTSDMLPGALSFGAVSEQQMMALSLAPNYYRALMEGASTSDIMEAYRQDMKNLPREYRQYITSILPGASEDLRAYVNSDYYGYLRAQNSTFYRGYDQDERGLIPGLESKRFEIAHANMESAHANAMTEIPNLNNANYNQPDKAFMMARMYSDNPYYAAPIVSPERASVAVSVAREISDSIAQVWGGKDTKLGDIIIQIDGDTVHSQEYGVQDFIRGNQSYVVGV